MCWEVVSPLLMALGNGPYSVIYSHPCMPSSPCSAFWSIFFMKNNIRKVTFCYYQIFLECQSFITVCTRQQQSNANCIRHIYIGGHFGFCLLQSITLIWPCLGTNLKFLHKSMDSSFVEHKITQNKKVWLHRIGLIY